MTAEKALKILETYKMLFLKKIRRVKRICAGMLQLNMV